MVRVKISARNFTKTGGTRNSSHARAAGAKIGAHRETRARRRAIILSSAKGNGKGTKMDGPGLRKTVLVLVRVGLFMGGVDPADPPWGLSFFFFCSGN